MPCELMHAIKLNRRGRFAKS